MITASALKHGPKHRSILKKRAHTIDCVTRLIAKQGKRHGTQWGVPAGKPPEKVWHTMGTTITMPIWSNLDKRIRRHAHALSLICAIEVKVVRDGWFKKRANISVSGRFEPVCADMLYKLSRVE